MQDIRMTAWQSEGNKAQGTITGHTSGLYQPGQGVRNAWHHRPGIMAAWKHSFLSWEERS